MTTSLERRYFSPIRKNLQGRQANQVRPTATKCDQMRPTATKCDQMRPKPYRAVISVPLEKITRPARPEVLAVVRAVFLHNEPNRTFFASAIWLLGNRLFNASVGTLRQAGVRSAF